MGRLEQPKETNMPDEVKTTVADEATQPDGEVMAGLDQAIEDHLEERTPEDEKEIVVEDEAPREETKETVEDDVPDGEEGADAVTDELLERAVHAGLSMEEARKATSAGQRRDRVCCRCSASPAISMIDNAIVASTGGERSTSRSSALSTIRAIRAMAVIAYRVENR